MATARQKKLAKLIMENATSTEPLNKGELLERAGYDTTTAEATPGRTIESVGVQNELHRLGFTEENAKNVVAEIMLNPDADDNARIRAAQEVFKVQGSYAPTKSIVANVDVNDEARAKATKAIEGYLGDS